MGVEIHGCNSDVPLSDFRYAVLPGTVAAAAQSSIGNIAAGSVFATLKSAGAGGAGLAAVNGVVQVGGGLITTLGSVFTDSHRSQFHTPCENVRCKRRLATIY